MTVQAVISGFCEGVTNAASVAGNSLYAAGGWMGKTVTAVGGAVASIAQAVANFAQPYFQAALSVAAPYQSHLLVGVVALAVGAIGYGIVSNLFCQPQDSRA